MKKRNVIVAVLLAVAVAGGSIGGYYGFRSMNRPVTMVYAVNELSSGYWGDNMTLDGMITSDASQNVYLSTEQKVKEVLVKEGDTVKEGDVLMTYDTTAKELELETMELDQKQNELKLDQAKKQLKQLKKTKPVSEDPLQPSLDDPGIEDPGIENPEDPGTENPEDPGIENPEDPDQEPTPTPEPSYDDAVVYDGTDNPLKGDAKAYKGTGEQSDPLVFLCQPGTVITGEFFNQMAGFHSDETPENGQEGRKSFWFRLEIREGNKASGKLQTVWEQDGSLIQEPYHVEYRTVFQMGNQEDGRPEILFEKPLSSMDTTVGKTAELEVKVRQEEGVSYRYQWFRKALTKTGQEEQNDSAEQGGQQEGQENGSGENTGDTEPWIELTENEGKTVLKLEAATEKDQGIYMVQVTAANVYGTSKAVATACLTVEPEEQEPTPDPTPSTEPTPTESPTLTPTETPTPEPTATVTPVPTAEPTIEPTVTPASTPTEAPTATPEPTVEPTAQPTPTEMPTPTETPAPTEGPAAVPGTEGAEQGSISAQKTDSGRTLHTVTAAAAGGSTDISTGSGSWILVASGSGSSNNGQKSDSSNLEVNL